MLPGPPVATREYRLGPFCLHSEIELVELRPAGHFTGKRTSVQLGGVPAQISDAVWVDEYCCLNSREWLLRIPGVARYFVRDGVEIRVEPEAQAAPEDVRTYLLGSCFGVLCYQNGFLPLHASAVEVDGRVTAFLGNSGAGKSTLAACLSRRGYAVVSDDICLLEPLPGKQWRVHPVAGWLKLWRASLEQLHEPVEETNRVFSRHDKYRVYLQAETERELRLDRLVFLDRPAEVRAPATLDPLGNASALSRLLGLVYLDYYPENAYGLPQTFQLGAEVLAAARPWRLCAPLGWDRMEGVLDLIETTFFLPGNG